MKKYSDKELLELYHKRRRDRERIRSRRKKKLESLPPLLSDLLTSYFKRDPYSSKKLEETRAVQGWAKIVGEAAAGVSKAYKIRNGKLVVFVKDPLWAQQLLLLKQDILKKYWRAYPKVKLYDIFFTKEYSA